MDVKKEPMAGEREQPIVTVLMPVFNGEKYLSKAIESILHQTFRDFELLIINDGSTDRSREIASSFGDHRIRILDNPNNMGIVASLNVGIDASQGSLLARMDADDIACPFRLKRQVAFMEQNSTIGICGGWVRTIGKPIPRILRKPTTAGEIKVGLFFQNVMNHSSIIFRTEWMRKRGLYYDQAFLHVEDWELWRRAANCFPLANIPEVLTKYRLHGGTVSARHKDDQFESIRRMCRRNLEYLGLGKDERDVDIHFAVSTRRFPEQPGPVFLNAAEQWFLQVYEANESRAVFERSALAVSLITRWMSVCLSQAETRIEAQRFFSKSVLREALKIRAKEWGRFFPLLVLDWEKRRPWIKQNFGRYFSSV